MLLKLFYSKKNNVHNKEEALRVEKWGGIVYVESMSLYVIDKGHCRDKDSVEHKKDNS